MNVNSQQIASILRQILAVTALVVGPLTAAVPSMHLPVAISGIITFIGGLIMTIEHYVSDPSTGNTTPASGTVLTVDPEVVRSAVKEAVTNATKGGN